VRAIVYQEYAAVTDALAPEQLEAGNFALARRIFEEIALADDYAEFLTIPAYDALEAG